MSFLDRVKEGKVSEPIFALIYGVPGIGKSTTASEADKPLFIGDEKESSHLDVARLEEPKNFNDVKEQIKELISAKGLKFKTLVLDNLGWLEPVIWKQVCDEHNKPTIESIGYGKGYKDAVNKHIELVSLLSELRQKQSMDIAIIGHSKVKTFQDPLTTSGYDRYQLSINEEAASVWYRSVDAILFMNYEVLKVNDDDKRAQGSGVRVMYTQERPSFQAKNRYGLPFRMVMPQGESWKTLKDAITKGQPEATESLLGDIDGLKQNIKDPVLLEKVNKSILDAKKDAVKLTAIKDRLIAVIGGLK